MADKPVTREEKYLAYLTGDYKGEIPKPITRKEKYLYELCLKGIGGEISPEEIKNAVNEYLEKNPVKPGATTEQAQQIEQNKADVASLKEETGSLKEDLDNELFEHHTPKNIFNKKQEMVFGQLTNDGINNGNKKFMSTVNPISVIGGRTISFSVIDSGAVRRRTISTLLVFDASNTIIYGGYVVSTPFNLPSNATHIKISMDTTMFNGYDKIQLEYGEECTEYTPYFTPYKTSNIKQLENAINTLSNKNVIDCWGDSLTQGTGATTGNAYPEVLSKLTGLTVHKYGFPGDDSKEIPGYQSSMPLLVQPCTINASGVTQITITSYDGSNGIPFRFPSLINQYCNINPVEVGGIKGNIDLSASTNPESNVFTFTRLENGKSKKITYPVPLITNSSKEDRKNIQVICIGQNGGWDNDSSILIKQIRNMINFQELAYPKYIVLGIPAGTTDSRAQLENDLLLEFGAHFINARDYLVSRGLADNDITPTETDLSDIKVGRVPKSLRYDTVHLNDYGYKVLANIVYNRGVKLGYWN